MSESFCCDGYQSYCIWIMLEMHSLCMTANSRHHLTSNCCVCGCDLDPIHGQCQGHGAFELPKTAHNCTFLGLAPPPLSRWSQNWWLVVIAWDQIYSLTEPDFLIFFLGKLSREFKLRGMSTFHEIQMVVREGTVRWLGMLIVLQVLCMLIWLWPKPRSRSRSRGFWTSKN